MKNTGLILATALVLVACGKTTTQDTKVALYGSHFAEENWVPAEGISQRGSIQRTRGSNRAAVGTSSSSTSTQTVFDQPFNFSGTNNGSQCSITTSSTYVSVGNSITLTLNMPSAQTYLANFASTNNAFQLNGINSSGNGVFQLTGYFNQQGTITVHVAAANVPYTTMATCSTNIQVSGSYNNYNAVWQFWSNWYSPPYYHYWPNAVPYYYGTTNNTIVNGNNNTINNTTNNSTTVVNVQPTPTPTPVPQPQAPSPVPLYRSHVAIAQGNGSIYEDYLYSQNQAEGAGVYTLEGAAFSVSPAPFGSFTVALMRCLVNGATSLPYHFLSTDPNCEGQRVEGALGWVAPGQVAGTSQLMRLYKSTTGAHLTTKSLTEVNYAQTLGYKYEGPQGWAY